MRRILIDDKLTSLAKRYAKTLFTSTGKGARPLHPKELLEELKGVLTEKKWDKHVNYIQTIIDNYDEILTLEPDQFKDYYKKYFKFLSEAQLGLEVELTENFHGLNKGKHPFYEVLVHAMRYDALREKYFMEYLKPLNIKSCVYCNAQYALILENICKEDGNSHDVALFQLDHFWPKSKYPFLCTSFFNLQPSCANCNSHKGKRNAKFDLYTRNKERLEPFKFDVSIGRQSGDILNLSDVSIALKSDDKGLLKNHEDLFLVDEVYKHHVCEVQETIIRTMFDNAAYRNQLRIALKSLFPSAIDDEVVGRLIYGHEMQPEQVHKRPLNKLVQDVVQQYGLSSSK